MALADTLKAAVRRLANALGYDIVGYDGRSDRWRMARLLERHRIAVLFDVGANCGTFGWDMRELGFRGRIVSFEPSSDAFAQLERMARADGNWQAVNVGLGDRDEDRLLNVAANSQSSSFLPMLDVHRQAAPESRYEKEERTAVRRLDGIFDTYCRPGEAAFLKIDTQGFEKYVLEGARGKLGAVPLIQLECSLVPLYEGANSIEDMIGYMRKLGYDPVDTLPTFYHHDTGHLMQADVIFLRR
jgi:FkbM family methyltransferase